MEISLQFDLNKKLVTLELLTAFSLNLFIRTSLFFACAFHLALMAKVMLNKAWKHVLTKNYLTNVELLLCGTQIF